MATVPKMGPADHGRPLDLDEFMAGDYEEGYQYELIDGRAGPGGVGGRFRRRDRRLHERLQRPPFVGGRRLVCSSAGEREEAKPRQRA